MLKPTPLVLLFPFILCGCAMTQQQIGEPDDVPSVTEDDPECKDSNEERPPDLRVVNINYMATPIKVSRDPVCARPGDVIWFKFNGRPSADVIVEAKDSSHIWLNGAGRQSWFYVVVPSDIDAPDAKRFYYTVKYKNKVLDPEVRVKNHYY